jgi:hypothetical protein
VKIRLIAAVAVLTLSLSGCVIDAATLGSAMYQPSSSYGYSYQPAPSYGYVYTAPSYGRGHFGDGRGHGRPHMRHGFH